MEPKIIIVGGIPGTGKTTLAELLSKRIEVSCFSKDKLEAVILRRGVASKDSLNGVGYALLAEIAQIEIAHGRSVILDCIAPAHRVIEFWQKIVNKNMVYIECICSDKAIHKQRIEDRTRQISGWYELTWSDVLKISESYSSFSENRIVIDSTNDLESNLQKVLNYMRIITPNKV